MFTVLHLRTYLTKLNSSATDWILCPFKIHRLKLNSQRDGNWNWVFGRLLYHKGRLISFTRCLRKPPCCFCYTRTQNTAVLDKKSGHQQILASCCLEFSVITWGKLMGRENGGRKRRQEKNPYTYETLLWKIILMKKIVH